MEINELLFDRMVEVILNDPATGELNLRLTNVRDGSVNTSADGEEITDAVGAPITTFYNAKRGAISGTNALFSLGLAAAQFGTTKEVATTTNKMVVPMTEVLTASANKLTLSKTPKADSVKFVYKLKNKQVAEKLVLTTGTASEGKFIISGSQITLPTGSEGDYWVEYEYESTTANKVVNKANNFPEVNIVKVKCLFRDPCNENEKYGGWIISNRGKIDPSSVEIGLSRTGGHSFSINLNKEYCSTEEELFYIVVDAE